LALIVSAQVELENATRMVRVNRMLRIECPSFRIA
jgi:hypothetical protein